MKNPSFFFLLLSFSLLTQYSFCQIFSSKLSLVFIDGFLLMSLVEDRSKWMWVWYLLQHCFCYECMTNRTSAFELDMTNWTFEKYQFIVQCLILIWQAVLNLTPFDSLGLDIISERRMKQNVWKHILEVALLLHMQSHFYVYLYKTSQYWMFSRVIWDCDLIHSVPQHKYFKKTFSYLPKIIKV